VTIAYGLGTGKHGVKDSLGWWFSDMLLVLSSCLLLLFKKKKT
jgi:hypothetical protein